jgi:predicted ATP-binding protein involved in virulence
LELHLHPPQQQVLISSLQRIGPDCQFILTSHSPYLETVTPAENEIRLPGGSPCL